MIANVGGEREEEMVEKKEREIYKEKEEANEK